MLNLRITYTAWMKLEAEKKEALENMIAKWKLAKAFSTKITTELTNVGVIETRLEEKLPAVFLPGFTSLPSKAAEVI